ncbi:ATP-binding protein [Lysobacter sp. LF1]|uniref:histidine kinase n=1 Tax=Lysobacter stagni TaxID=3045172 RepID=A0ABT6XCS3_9GAMM|nr:ATP-binding protein [Lysobacter sp. LF1]MDI9237941.1 ATP-binding protein [Lysobacter sp. LF1]
MDQEFAIGVRPEYAPLLPLIDEVLAGLDSSQRQAVRSRWLTTEYHYGVPWGWVIGGLLAAALVLGAIAIAYLRLRRTSRALESAERALAAQLGFQQALLETVPYPVFVKDEAGRYIAINRAYEQTMNRRREDMVGRTLPEIRHLPGVDLDALHEEELALIASGSSKRRELLMVDPGDGTTHHMIAWLQAFSDAATGRTALLGTAVDITEVREAEARARASEQKLSEFTQAIPATVFQFRVNPDGTRAFSNIAGNVQTMLGMRPDQIIANEPALFARLHPDDQAVLVRKLDAVVASRQPMPPFDFRLRMGDRWIWLRTEGGQPHDLEDGAVEWSGYWIDVTEEHDQADALQRAKAQAEAATAAKGAFLAAMSHEIRTPMADVLALLELLARTRMEREQSHMLGMVQESARAMLQVLEDILDYSRIESGRLHIEDTRFDLRELIDNLSGVFAARAASKDVVLRSIVDWRLAATFHGDPFRIRQIVSNLASNAVKFTEQGSVTLRVELGHDSGTRQRLLFTVTDTGIGIDPDGLARLFQPFTQAEESTTRRFGGTGLGLSISRRLAEMMGGEVRLESSPGVGTRAILEIPLKVAGRAIAIPEFAGKLAVLACVDDAREEELSNALSALGFRVMELEAEDLDEPLDDVDLFVTTPATARLAPLAGVVCLLADDNPSHRAVRQECDCIVVPTAPLLWRNLQEACHIAFGTTPSVVAAREEQPFAPQRARILVAEDHITNRAVMARQLEAIGYRHTIVENGAQALHALSRAHYDALITDCHMPEVDGYELARRIRAQEVSGQRLLIVGISASAQPEQIARCREAGMDDFITKPVQLGDLASVLQRHLGQDDAVAAPEAALATPSSDPLTQLRKVIPDPRELKAFLEDLLHASREDLAQLERIRHTTQDEAAQRELLHRIEGALAVIDRSSEMGIDEGAAVDHRTQAAVAGVERLASLLRQLDAGDIGGAART